MPSYSPSLIRKNKDGSIVVGGWANVAARKNGTTVIDSHGDYTTPEELQSAAYEHVYQWGISNIQHQMGTDCGVLVESIAFTAKKAKAMGLPEGSVPLGWWVAYRYSDPTVVQAILDGTLRSFSIEGVAEMDPD